MLSGHGPHLLDHSTILIKLDADCRTILIIQRPHSVQLFVLVVAGHIGTFSIDCSHVAVEGAILVLRFLNEVVRLYKSHDTVRFTRLSVDLTEATRAIAQRLLSHDCDSLVELNRCMVRRQITELTGSQVFQLTMRSDSLR